VPLLSWSDANTLGVIGVNEGQYIFWLYDLRTKTKLPRELDKFSNIRSFSFSNNGRLVILSADFEGQNDLFLLSSRRDRTKRLTHDSFDDLDPQFIPNSSTIVFSSNRVTDSLTTDVKTLQKLSPYYNLFLYNIDTTTNRLKRVTHTLSKDFHARAMDSNNFFYLSDQRGITNLFRYNTISGTYSQVTNFNTGIKDYDLNFEDRVLSVVLSQDLHENIFIQRDFNFDRQVFTPSTKRKEILQAKNYIQRKKTEPVKATSLKDLINSRIKERGDSVVEKPVQKAPEVKNDSVTIVKKAKNEISTDNYSFDDEPPKKEEPKEIVVTNTEKPTVKPKEKTISTDDYSFEDDAVKQKQKQSESFLTRYAKAREVSKVQGPFPYMPKFSYDNLVANFVIDPLRGFSMKWETQMNDMLENYRINAGVQFSISDIKSGDVFGEFQYLPHRLDFSARIDRKVIDWQTKSDLDQQGAPKENQKYSFQKIELGVSYPISVRTRVAIKPFVGFTEFVDRGYVLNSSSSAPIASLSFMPSKYQFYTGARAEVVYDNSITTGLNIIEGTRGKFSAITYHANGASKKSFAQVYADVRHYQRIYKEIVLAVRGYAGTFFGSSPKKYMLGGVDNWVLNNSNYSGKQNPLVNGTTTYNENLLFSEFATGLRGFDYVTQYGNSVALANIEFRIPLVRALASGPITSNFFRNLQFTGFYDIGSSWTGAIPFGSANDGPQRVVSSGRIFTIDIKQYLNPWLYSYGAGFRSMIFGYYLKCDMAWPVVNYQVLDPRVQVSLGFDF
jgi:hypothetical protein